MIGAVTATLQREVCAELEMEMHGRAGDRQVEEVIGLNCSPVA